MALDIDRVREVAERVAASSGLEVVEIEFLGGGKARMLRVFLDKPAAGADPLHPGKPKPGFPGAPMLGGVTHGDCANFSREFGTILDVEDVMPGSYTLEVSSPGLDRKLIKAADFTRFVGSRVKLMTRQLVNNNRHFEGRLESFENGRLTLDLSVASKKSQKKMGAAAGQKLEIEFANVEKANLVPEI
ncbi:Ribosome maturation factor RimP [Candidatus Sulfotelmatobacter kueseliae]|uniref:Ribosome maturation factor RimP n=1 Tax=Candidatus Sulfotelmatobacter kueseliae TaxID=2042962 RepID=A0A2U3JVW9_9BACT|nr:Ribosome maturation factor RimP [Candidatus Sulfotelmatobacter kueseliae]